VTGCQPIATALRRKDHRGPKLAQFSWGKVDSGLPGDCWPWTGPVNTWGYGACAWSGKATNASRAAYESINGPAGSLVVCHSCDNPICCNPGHLRAATQADNLAECRAKGRQAYRRGADHHRASAKLTPELVRKARAMYSAGISQTEIGKEMGVASSGICRLISGKIWGHVK